MTSIDLMGGATLTDFLDVLPANQRKHLDPASPPPMRMMAAKGMAPLPPRDMMITLCGLRLDENEKLAASANKALRELPDKLLGPVLQGTLPEICAPVLGELLQGRDAMLEHLVLNRKVSDDVVATVAVQASATLAEIIAGDQQRCLRSESIVDAIRHNTELLKSSRDRLFDFLVRSGVFFEDMPEIGEAMARLNPTELKEVADTIVVPEEARHLLEESEESDARATEAVAAMDKLAKTEESEVHERVPMLKLVASLNVAQKIALALKGNKEARTILIRENNKLVATAAIRSPRLTEPEVLAAAKSRSVSDEVIRIIARSKDMTRAYAVKRALVENPKAPVQTAMRMLTLLREADIRSISKSRNVSRPIAAQAKRLMAMRKR